MYSKFFCVPILLFLALLLTSCGGGNSKITTDAPPNDSNYIATEIKSIDFGVLKGIPEYQYFSSYQGSPLSGKTNIKVITFGDILSLDVTIISEAKVSRKYTSQEPIELDEFINEWIIEVDLPIGESSVLAAVESKDGVEYSLEKKVSTKSAQIKLIRSSHIFSPGPNFLTVQVINFGEDAEFIISATDNNIFVGKQFSPKSIFLGKGETTSISIPVTLPRNLTKDIDDYLIEVKVKNIETEEVNLAKMSIRIEATSTGVSNDYKLVVPNLGKCSPVPKSNSTVTVAIVGSSKLILDNVDDSSIFWMNGRIKPISVNLADRTSFDTHSCDDLQPDGLNDLIMTFSLQEILGSINPNINEWPAHIYYNNKNGLSGDILHFTMKVGE